MPSEEEVRENGRRNAATNLVKWAKPFEGDVERLLLARLIIALESLEEVIRAQSPRP
jgi:hypothetical protein